MKSREEPIAIQEKYPRTLRQAAKHRGLGVMVLKRPTGQNRTVISSKSLPMLWRVETKPHDDNEPHTSATPFLAKIDMPGTERLQCAHDSKA